MNQPVYLLVQVALILFVIATIISPKKVTSNENKSETEYQ